MRDLKSFPMHNLPPISGALAQAAAVFGGAFGNLHRQVVEAAARHEEQEMLAKVSAQLERFEPIDYAAVERRIVQRMLGRRPIPLPGKSLPNLLEVLDLDALTDEQIAMLGHARKLRTSGVSSTLVVWLNRPARASWGLD